MCWKKNIAYVEFSTTHRFAASTEGLGTYPLKTEEDGDIFLSCSEYEEYPHFSF